MLPGFFVFLFMYVNKDDGDEVDWQKDPFEGHVDTVDYGIYHF